MAFVTSAPLRLTPTSRGITRHRAPKPLVAQLPKPVADRILVRRDKAERSVGGLVITGETEKSKTGVVVDVGKGRYSPEGVLENISVAQGDRVFWKDEYGAEEVDDHHVFLRAFSVVAKI